MPRKFWKTHAPMGLQDALLLWADSCERPLHVGGYFICKPPPRSHDHFVRRLVRRLRQQPANVAPWNYRMTCADRLGFAFPSWEKVQRADMQYHVVHHALPEPGNQQALDDLISRLHSERLDMARPLWQYHVIEGLPHHRFAIYHKVHHALVDGAIGMQSFMQGSAGDAASRVRPVWSSPRRQKLAAAASIEHPPRTSLGVSALQSLASSVMQLSDCAPALLDALARVLDATSQRSSALVPPCSAPDTMFNARVSSRRCVAAVSLELSVLRAIAQRHAVTVNDVLLTICGIALRRYLGEHDASPDHPLVALVPVALTRADSECSGNSLGAVYASLGGKRADAMGRIRSVSRSMRAGKSQLHGIPQSAQAAYCMLTLLPLLLNLCLPRLISPSANVVISNLHGPEHARYLNGASIERLCPLSTIVPGLALNITCVSYCEQLFLGIVTCPEVMPDLTRFTALLEVATSELHAASTRSARARARR